MRSPFAICVLLLAVASAARGADHFPFTEGIIYDYEYSTQQRSGTFITYFSGTTDVGGTITRVRHFGGDVHDGLMSFWSETPERDKLFHGSHFPRLGPPLYFSPPILMLDEPLYVGKTWVVDSRDSDSLAVHVRFEVTGFGEVRVPAGTFQAFTIDDTWEFPEGIPASMTYAGILGIWIGPVAAQQTVRRIYADGVGLLVWEEGSRTDRLISYRTVAVQPTTWTRIRMLYR